MKISKKRTVQVMVFAIALLLVLALSIGITGAWYQAKRQASGTVIMDQGIIIDYKGFAENADATTWGKGVNLKLFTLTDDAALPGQQIPVNSGAISSIKANVKSVDFYARVKLDYKFYNVVGDVKTEVPLANASKLITTSTKFFGDSWIKSQNNDGWYYYGADTTLGKLTPSAGDAGFVALFANDAKFVIEGANFEGAENGGEGGGFKVGDKSINKIEVTLTLETLQGSADSDSEHWYIVPPPVVENFSSNNLTDASGTVLTPSETTLTPGTTYQVVNDSNAGYKFTVTNTVSGQAQTLASVDVSVVNGEATITGYTGKPTELTIPDYITVNGQVYKVTSIGNSAFKNCTQLRSVTISDSVISIGNSAFYSCKSLGSISFPKNVGTIGEYAFYFCSALKEIIIPINITEVGKQAFGYCTGVTSISIYSKGYIRNAAFSECSNLQKVFIMNEIKGLDTGTFGGCKKLTSIEIISDSFSSTGWIPASVTDVIISENNTKLASDSNAIFAKQDNNNLELRYFYSNKTQYEIPSILKLKDGDWSVVSIASNAFAAGGSLTSLTIPNTVKNIKRFAFSGCTNLTKTIGEGWMKVSDSSAVDASTLLKDITYDIKRA